MRSLEVLNIRNVPLAEHAAMWPNVDPTFKGLATALVEQLMCAWPYESPGWSKLRITAIGSLTHRDYCCGDNVPSTLDDVLQRRTYHIGYYKDYHNQWAASLTLLARGCVCTEQTTKDIAILRPYWLG